jgi:AcrR family transcriptional regulator
MAITGIRTSAPELRPDHGAATKATPVKRQAGRRSPAQASGDETRLKIIRACKEALNTEGITGASARTIARLGDFNQALIFYHFGSVEGLLIASAKSEGEVRSRRYAERFGSVTTLPELIAIGREVHLEEQADGSVNVLTQLLAGAASSPELQRGILEAIKPWMVLVEEATARVLQGSSLLTLVPTGELAFAISAFFLGVELLTGLDPAGDRAGKLFDSFERGASLLQTLVAATR